MDRREFLAVLPGLAGYLSGGAAEPTCRFSLVTTERSDLEVDQDTATASIAEHIIQRPELCTAYQNEPRYRRDTQRVLAGVKLGMGKPLWCDIRNHPVSRQAVSRDRLTIRSFRDQPRRSNYFTVHDEGLTGTVSKAKLGPSQHDGLGELSYARASRKTRTSIERFYKNTLRDLYRKFVGQPV